VAGKNKKIMPKFCPNCGVNISENTKYCPDCGADVLSFIPGTGQSAEGPVPASDTGIMFNFFNMHPVAIWVCAIYVLYVIVDTYYRFPIGYAVLYIVITLGIGFLCGRYAANKWAPKINGSQAWAFVLPFTTNLVGLACYWFYYKYKLEGKTLFLIGFLILALVIVLMYFILIIGVLASFDSNLQTTTAVVNTTNTTAETYVPPVS
jgi:hypothetical protein